MKIEYSKRLAYSPAFTSVMVEFAELLKKRQTPPRLEFGNHAQVIYITNDDASKVLGATVFNLTPELEGVIMFSFVDSEYRGQGLYQTMYTEAEKMMIDQGAVVIGSGTAIDNIEMRKAMKLSGRTETSVRSVKWLTKQI